MFNDQKTLEWLMLGDPSIRWQTLRDLVQADEKLVRMERLQVARTGWGARLLKKQDRDGLWAGSLYNRKWVSTTYTLLLLRQLGLQADHSQAHAGCRVLLDSGFSHDQGINFWQKRYPHSETCVTGMVLSILCYFHYDDPRVDLLAEHLVRQQMADGGWNCQSYRGAVHGSFHSTINVLEGLHEYEKFRIDQALPEATKSQQLGREFLLIHRLYRSHRTNKVVHPALTRFSFPPQWHYDVLRVLDYFQAVQAPLDDRLQDALTLVLKKRTPQGRWLLQNRHPGRSWFEMEKAGAASRWNTLRALRVLAWQQRNGAC
jgi:hypothetical protein